MGEGRREGEWRRVTAQGGAQADRTTGSGRKIALTRVESKSSKQSNRRD